MYPLTRMEPRPLLWQNRIYRVGWQWQGEHLLLTVEPQNPILRRLLDQRIHDGTQRLELGNPTKLG